MRAWIAMGAVLAGCAVLVATLLQVRTAPPAQAAKPALDAPARAASGGAATAVEMLPLGTPAAGELRASAEPPLAPALPEPDGLEDGAQPAPIAPPGDTP